MRSGGLASGDRKGRAGDGIPCLRSDSRRRTGDLVDGDEARREPRPAPAAEQPRRRAEPPSLGPEVGGRREQQLVGGGVPARRRRLVGPRLRRFVGRRLVGLLRWQQLVVQQQQFVVRWGFVLWRRQQLRGQQAPEPSGACDSGARSRGLTPGLEKGAGRWSSWSSRWWEPSWSWASPARSGGAGAGARGMAVPAAGGQVTGVRPTAEARVARRAAAARPAVAVAGAATEGRGGHGRRWPAPVPSVHGMRQVDPDRPRPGWRGVRNPRRSLRRDLLDSAVIPRAFGHHPGAWQRPRSRGRKKGGGTMWVIFFVALLLVVVVAMARLGTKDPQRPVRRGRRKRNGRPGRGGKSWWAGGSGSAGGAGGGHHGCGGGGSSCGSGCGGGGGCGGGS